MTSPAATEAETETEAAAPRHRSVRRFAAFLSVALGVMGLLHAYLGARLFTFASPVVADLGWLGLFLLLLSIPSGLLLARFLPGPVTRALQLVARLWMGTFAILLTSVVATDLVTLFARLLGQGAWLSAHRPALAVGLAMAGVAWAVWSARFRLVVERVEVPLAGLGAGMDGLKIVQISDVHIGELLDRRFMQKVVDAVNGLGPDVIAVTGDLVDGKLEELAPEVAPLAQLKASYGAYYVIGNHELYWGAEGWTEHVRSLGLTVLHNEHRVLSRDGARLVLGGVPDITAEGFVASLPSRPDLAFARAPEGVPRVLLAHQPKSALAASRAGVALQLSGHTHAGQIFPFNFFVRLQQPVVRGLKQLHGLWVYTHRGTGYWGPPMRLGAPPEIAVITLRRAA
jgi:predicted MPP superfamily phosphohydrolase